MNCEEFWKKYDESGLSDELTAHLDDCETCCREVGFERDLMKRVRELPVYEAPDTAWENISREIGVERPESERRSRLRRSIRDATWATAASSR